MLAFKSSLTITVIGKKNTFFYTLATVTYVYAQLPSTWQKILTGFKLYVVMHSYSSRPFLCTPDQGHGQHVLLHFDLPAEGAIKFPD